MEKIQTWFFRITRSLIFLVILIFYFTFALTIMAFSWDKETRRHRTSNNAHRFSKLVCWFFGFHYTVKNPWPKELSGLVVSNHMGFVDIFTQLANAPMLFVTSVEMRDAPFIGWLTETSGCLYVERRNRMNIQHELSDMIEYLQKGYRVVLYPEATSHNGEELLPFKRTLITAAAFAKVPILPVCFNFVSLNNEPFSLKYRDFLCWAGPVTFMQTLLGIFGIRKIVCEIECLPPVYTSVDDDRGEVADRLHAMITAKFRPVIK